jgi:hypothetical protein
MQSPEWQRCLRMCSRRVFGKGGDLSKLDMSLVSSKLKFACGELVFDELHV